jgi:hypothetical protein
MALSVQNHEHAREAAAGGRTGATTRPVIVHRLHTMLLLVALTMGMCVVILQTR